MHRNIFRVFIIALLILSSTYAYGEDETVSSQEISFPQSWFEQKNATGDWGGFRNKIDDSGLTFTSNYTTNVGGNPVGGKKKTVTYCAFQDITLAVDFEKLVSLNGLHLTVSNCLATGRNLSDTLGDFFGVQEIYAPGDYYFGELDLSLSLFEKTLTFEVGRLFAGDVFATSPLWQYYVNSGINDNLNSIGANIFFPSFQVAAWAARITYSPNEQWELVTGLYNADPSVKDPDRHGVNFNFDTSHGALLMSQLTHKWQNAHKKKNLPGSVCFGGYYASDKYEDLSVSGRLHKGNYGFYFTFDQMLYRSEWPSFSGPEDKRLGTRYADRVKGSYHPQTSIPLDRPKGLSLWGGAYLAPDDNINTQIYQLAGGLVFQGLAPNRDLDVTALCFLMGKFSNKMPEQGAEIALEVNHRFQLGPWFYITPDVQYIINPNGQTDIKDALVLGFEMSVDF
ncbi:MAG: carbohydrate porin [Candidatus Ancaeobacter aquaticus]|nr:carbohydrate porin [Candidatus Ancaeobacter aquaticus]